MDFTVIIRVRQQFGADRNAFEGTAERSSHFVGAAKEFEFRCPDVDRESEGVLHFQSFGVSHRRNALEVNGQPVFGGIPRSGDFVQAEGDAGPTEIPVWNSHVLLIGRGVLRESNILRVESRDPQGENVGELDDFVIDNMVVLFKTTPRDSASGGGGPAPPAW